MVREFGSAQHLKSLSELQAIREGGVAEQHDADGQRCRSSFGLFAFGEYG